MLVAAIKSGNPLAGKAVVYNEDDDSFSLTGAGAITATKLLEYEDRGQLQWADLVTREWTLETAAIKARAEAAAGAAAEAAATAAAVRAAAEAVVRRAELDRIAPMPIVYEPPSTVPPVQQGIPAKAPGFELGPAAERQARWVVFAEPAPGESRGAQPATGTAPGDPSSPRAPIAPAVPSLAPPPTQEGATLATAVVPVAGAAASDAPAVEATADGAGGAGRRGDRRRALRAAERRREMAGARVRIALYGLAAIAAAVILFLVERGSL